MARLHVAFVLDLFQHASQSRVVIDQIASECYWPLVELLNSDLGPRFTVSLANSLAHRLNDCGHGGIINRMKSAMQSGAVEMIHTGAYHAIFPMIPEPEVKRQIELDIESKSTRFELTRRTGIFSPELCYDDRLLPLYKEMGFRWTLVDDAVMELNGVAIPNHEIPLVNGFAVIMRSSLWSDRIRQKDGRGRHLTGREFVDQLQAEIAGHDRDTYKVIALAGETFGHHVRYFQETFLRDMLFALKSTDSIRLCAVTELLESGVLQRKEKARENERGFKYFPPCSSATRPDDYQRGDPYPMWSSKGNPIHEGLWDLTDLILEACRDIDFTNAANEQLRYLLDRAFYSTQYFWCSIWDWNPKQVCEGIDRQMRALYKCVELTDNRRILKVGREIYTRLMWEIYKRSNVSIGGNL